MIAQTKEKIGAIHERQWSIFTEFLLFLSNVNAWIRESQKRKRIATIILYFFLMLELDLHFTGCQHYGEYPQWYQRIPLASEIISIIGKILGAVS